MDAEAPYLPEVGSRLPPAPPTGPARALRHGFPVGIDVALVTGMRTETSFDLWSTEQVLLVYERYFGKLDPKARRRIVEDARLNGWDRSWGSGAELLAA